MTTRTYDPIAVETHRRALENLTGEMATTLERTSGSPVVVEAKDFSTCILDAEVEHLAFAAYVLCHTGSSLLGVRTLVDSLGPNPELRPGDGWILNDPHTGGALHQGDVAIIQPMFHETDHIGWAFSNMHVLDVGGSGISGFATTAQDVYEEGMRFPPLKIIENGAIIPAWAEYIAANVRVPGPVLNDLRSMVAANNVGQRRLDEVIGRFGRRAHDEYNRISKDLTEEAFRARITRIPDGVYESYDWIEFDGHGEDLLLEVSCELEVAGSDLNFRFRGAPQIPAFINTTKATMYGQTMVELLVTLAYGDLPFNAGMWRPLSIDIGEPGTVINALPPAPVSSGHSEVGTRVCKLVKDVLSQALVLSDDRVLRSRVAAQAQDGYVLAPFTGSNQHGRPCVGFYVDNCTGIGAGGQSFMDGQDAYGCTSMSGCGLPDVETHEAYDPVLFLWRRLPPNTGGPGVFRGGQGMEQAFVIDYVDQLLGSTTTSTARIPPGGFGGGLPGSTCGFVPMYESNVAEVMSTGAVPTTDNVAGREVEVPSKINHLVLPKGTVMRCFSGGGGGLGDPLMRDPEAVARDVRDEYVTIAHAAATYGVALTEDGEVDVHRTQARRDEIRRTRIGAEPVNRQEATLLAGASVVPRGDAWTCGYCGYRLCSATENWRNYTALAERDIAERFGEWGMVVRARGAEPRVVLREYYCGGCAALLTSDVVPHGFRTLPAAVLAQPNVRPDAVELDGRVVV